MIDKPGHNGVSRRTVLRNGFASGLVFIGGTLAGCIGNDSDPPVEALEMEIVDIRVPDIGITSATIPVVFEVRNTDGEREVPTPTIDYNAYVEEIEVASARKDVASLGPGDVTREEFELIAEYTNLGTAIIEAIKTETFTVRVVGSVESEGATVDFEVGEQFR